MKTDQPTLYTRAAYVDRRHHLISRAFKKAFLVTNPEIEVAPEGLFQPLWKRNQIRDFSAFLGVCYSLSMPDLKRIHKKVRAAHDDLRDLEVSGLIRVLKKLSLLLYTGPDEHLWKSANGKIFLISDQLKPEGRLGKIPLKALLERFGSNVWKRKDQDPAVLAMLTDEHRCSPEDIQSLVDIIESNRGLRGKEVHRLVSARIDKIIAEKFRARRPAALPSPEFTEDPELRRLGEISRIIRQLDNIYKKRQLSDSDITEAETIKTELQERYGLTKEEIYRKLTEAERARTRTVKRRD